MGSINNVNTSGFQNYGDILGILNSDINDVRKISIQGQFSATFDIVSNYD